MDPSVITAIRGKKLDSVTEALQGNPTLKVRNESLQWDLSRMSLGELKFFLKIYYVCIHTYYIYIYIYCIYILDDMYDICILFDMMFFLFICSKINHATFAILGVFPCWIHKFLPISPCEALPKL